MLKSFVDQVTGMLNERQKPPRPGDPQPGSGSKPGSEDASSERQQADDHLKQKVAIARAAATGKGKTANLTATKIPEPSGVSRPPAPSAGAEYKPPDSKENAPEKATGDLTKNAEGKIVFDGQVLTAPNGSLKIAPESRNLCALFSTGLWLVSNSHRRSPLVTSVALTARQQGYQINDPTFVTPDLIQQAYAYADRQISMSRLDDNAIRRKIVETLLKAREAGANDIHIEAASGRTKVEFRVDGGLRLWETWTQSEGERILSTVYAHSSVQSGATANWLEPQAAMLIPHLGSDSIQLPDGIISVRCQWMPLADGRYLDMRLQYDGLAILGEGILSADVDSLGFAQEQMELVRSLRNVPGAIRAISGPTNQGKTSTLRVILNRRMSETFGQLNCLLIEDPPEGGVIGARQIGVAASTNDDQRERTFIGIMRAALRLDPDIVMLGETRDLTTATFMFRLALSGRQVYTTLHVYAALAIPQRLRDLGIEPYLVYDHNLLRGMMCQRLLKGLCKHCRIPILEAVKVDQSVEEMARRVRGGLALTAAERQLVTDSTTPFERVKEPDMRGVFIANLEGCKHCYKGRSGRTVAAEVIEADGKIMGLLLENKMVEARDYWLSPHGMNGMTMLWHGIEKIRRGEVTPQDAEFELGPVIRERELKEVEKVIGPFKGGK